MRLTAEEVRKLPEGTHVIIHGVTREGLKCRTYTFVRKHKGKKKLYYDNGWISGFKDIVKLIDDENHYYEVE